MWIELGLLVLATVYAARRLQSRGHAKGLAAVVPLLWIGLEVPVMFYLAFSGVVENDFTITAVGWALAAIGAAVGLFIVMKQPVRPGYEQSAAAFTFSSLFASRSPAGPVYDKAGFCTGCGQRVWVRDDGSCANGHPASYVDDVYPVPQPTTGGR
jgi:hypothetical protein